ncbi:MAG TPA: hypothetical protein VHA33_22595 [Candidatus Angelobacter sp.]|jgi:hypothetical protein|nr:hypothetical protein [Candidatus Angelobacter sp.]
MPDETQPAPASSTPPQSDRGIGHISMAEEMDSARWTLPPIVPILIGLAGVVIVLGIVALVFRAKPTASGSIEKVIAVQQGENVLVAIHVKFNNLTDELLHIRNLTAELETADGTKHNDIAAAASDIDRYFQAFPELGEGRTTPLKEELKIPAKTQQTGMAIFSYPIDKASFDKRKSLTMHIDFYDHAPLVARQQ